MKALQHVLDVVLEIKPDSPVRNALEDNNIDTVFQRFNSDNQPIGRYQSLYIVTNVNGHWGVQARSSLAP